MSVCLVMIVRNEAHVIKRCLLSHKDVIDTWCIVDTGSTDGTQDIVRETMAELGIPGELHERKWVDFGTNKTEMLALARGKADYLLHNDADHVWHGTIPKDLTAPCYAVQYKYAMVSYGVVCLLSTKHEWRYVGVLHEFVESVPVDPAMKAAPLTTGWIEVFHEGARSRDPTTYQKDIAVLERGLEAEPNNQRYVFYLAQSHRDAGNPEEAIKWYKKRTEMVGWPEETWYAYYSIGLCLERMGKGPEEVVPAYLAAFNFRPTRAEPLHRLAFYYRARSEHSLSYLFASHAAMIPLPNDSLFVEIEVYQWRALDELGVAAYYTDHRHVGLAAVTEVLKRPYPASEKQRLERNLQFYSDSALDKVAA